MLEQAEYKIQIAAQSEYSELGRLMADVYSSLDGFPTKTEQPNYYTLFDNLNLLASSETTDLISARTQEGQLLGCVVYFGDMQFYGSGGTATRIQNASGLRLLAVASNARGIGIGRMLTEKCIVLARDKQHDQVILHTTEYMKAAWGLYEKLGFNRFEAIDFLQGELPVYGFNFTL